MRSLVAFLIFALIGSIADAARSQDICSFAYISSDGLLTSAFKELPPDVLAKNPELQGTLRRALPNMRRAFESERGYTALVGWGGLPADYSKYSEIQARESLFAMAELSKRTVNAGKDFKISESHGSPISLMYTLDYVDGGRPYRDISIDIIATGKCIVSAKFGGPRNDNDELVWQDFRNEFERIRSIIAAREGPVAFSKSGAFFSFLGLLNIGISGLAAAFLGTVIAVCLARLCKVTPGIPARRYSLVIILVSLAALGIKAIFAAWIGAMFFIYDGIFLYILILAIHLNAYIRQSANSVLVAMAFVLALFIVDAIYMALGWRELPQPAEAVGAVIGLAMLAYSLNATLSRKNADMEA